MPAYPRGNKWIYQARRITTQDNVGGGKLVTRISIATGQIAILKALRVVGPANATTLDVYLNDEDNQMVSNFAVIASGASRSTNLPSIGSAATAEANVTNTTDYVIAPGEFIVVSSAAALQTQTQLVGVKLELYNLPTIPTWDNTGSAGTPNMAASTISATNTLQQVMC